MLHQVKISNQPLEKMGMVKYSEVLKLIISVKVVKYFLDYITYRSEKIEFVTE